MTKEQDSLKTKSNTPMMDALNEAANALNELFPSPVYRVERSLERIYDAEQQIEQLTESVKAKIKELIPPEIQAEIDDLEAYLNSATALQKAIIDQHSKMVKEVLTEEVQETVHSEHKSAVYTPPGETVDMPGLKGYAVAHPEVNIFFKEKAAVVAIRNRKVK